MPARIRLQRRGKKGNPFFHIVIADGRAPRDGRFIETIGTYNPLTKPASIELDSEKALKWLQNGATPTETVNAIFKYKGVALKYHLLKGVKKGALTQEQADAKFQTWIQEKEAKIKSKVNENSMEEKQTIKKMLEAEVKANLKKAELVAAKKAKEAAKSESRETAVEEPVAEISTEAPVAEVSIEAPVAEVKVETPVAEVTVEAPVAETPATTEENPVEPNTTEKA